MPNRAPFSIDEWYHCYNRGVDKRKIFENCRDYERFLLGMFAGNSEVPVHISNLKSPYLRDVLADSSFERGEPLVEIGAYCLMPNHIHLLLREVTEGGIARFMQKLCTGYTMYFNSKRERTGALFAGTFKSKHVPDDRYLKYLASYIHLNPAELFDPKWKNGQAHIPGIKKELEGYRYSSLVDFLGQKRLENCIIGETLPNLYEKQLTLSEVVQEAHEYYQENIEVKP
jgi:putative transposase